jgi:hypothetical protein
LLVDFLTKLPDNPDSLYLISALSRFGAKGIFSKEGGCGVF